VLVSVVVARWSNDLTVICISFKPPCAAFDEKNLE
jgi:hypothetical protein